MTHNTNDLTADFYIDLLLQLPGYIVVTDKQSRCIYTNNHTAKLLGYANQDKMQGVSPHEVRCPSVESASEFIAQDEIVIQSGNNLTILNIHTYADGAAKILLTKKMPYKNRKTNEIIGIICHGIEMQADSISQVCAALTQSDKKLRTKNTALSRCYALGTQHFKKQLSEREMDCVFYLLRGNTMKQIGKALEISPRTVESHIEQIKLKLNCTSKTDIVDYCLSEGLLNYVPNSILKYGFSKIIHVGETI